MGFFSKGLKNEFERAVVNEPSVFQPLKFYCNLHKDDVRGDVLRPPNGTIPVAEEIK